MSKNSYTVKVHIMADTEEEASKKVATALTGRDETWEIIEFETQQVSDNLIPTMREAKATKEMIDKILKVGEVQ